MKWFTAWAVALVSAFGLHAAADPGPVTPSVPVPALRIVVHKAERKLELFRGNQLWKHYRVGLGFAPLGTKTAQGDGRTPEGTYFICVKNARSRFYRSLGINYPNRADADLALGENRISREQHAAILAAEKKRATPPWNTSLGGEIFIHGNGSASDWTLGCVALDDAEMLELFETVPRGTVVVILP